MAELNKPEDYHAKYSPSKLPRLIRCPGSSMTHKDMGSSSFAIEGTLCHEVTADHLEKRNFVVDMSHPIVVGFTEDKRTELVEAIQDCLDFSRVIIEANADAEVMIESRVSMEGFTRMLGCPGLKEVAGTVDLYITVPSQRRLYSIDWKYGAGIEVWPDSEQVIAYGTAAMVDFIGSKDYDEVHLYIGQPRLYSGTKFKDKVMKPEEMLTWAMDTLAPAINICENLSNNNVTLEEWKAADGKERHNLVGSDAEIFNPSEKACQWCSHKMACDYRLAQANKDAATIFAAYTNLPTNVTTKQLVDFRDAAKHYKAYISDIEKHIYKELMGGREVPGLKMVAGKSNRVYKDKTAFVMWSAENMPDAEIFAESPPLSPAKAETLVKRTFKGQENFKEIMKSFQELIEKPTGAPTIVLEKDPRPALQNNDASEVFAAFTTKED